jgi:hypothetical protein
VLSKISVASASPSSFVWSIRLSDYLTESDHGAVLTDEANAQRLYGQLETNDRISALDD